MEPELAAIVDTLVPGAGVGASYVRARLTPAEVADITRLGDVAPGTALCTRLRALAWEALFTVGDGSRALRRAAASETARVIVHDRVPVCVVGLGAAGGTIASRIAARGVHVVGLETGPPVDRSRFTDDEVAHVAERTLMHVEPEVLVLDDGPPIVAPWVSARTRRRGSARLDGIRLPLRPFRLRRVADHARGAHTVVRAGGATHGGRPAGVEEPRRRSSRRRGTPARLALVPATRRDHGRLRPVRHVHLLRVSHRREVLDARPARRGGGAPGRDRRRDRA